MEGHLLSAGRVKGIRTQIAAAAGCWGHGDLEKNDRLCGPIVIKDVKRKESHSQNHVALLLSRTDLQVPLWFRSSYFSFVGFHFLPCKNGHGHSPPYLTALMDKSM